MDHAFDVDKHIARIGARLVREFDEARAATSPTAVGDAMEFPVRKQLEQLLPRGIAVGSGFLIDSYGATSSQTDLVLYERDICPVFSINDTPGTTYYPCEGVIAVGQVKSTLTKTLMKDEFKKIASVKRLQRYPVHDFMPHPTTGGPIVLERSYGNIRNPSIIDVGEKKAASPSRQIFGFMVAGASQMSTDTLTNAFTEFTSKTGEGLSPNMAVLLSGGLLTWGNVAKEKLRETKWSEQNKSYSLIERTGNQLEWRVSWSAEDAEFLRYAEDTETFRELIRWIAELYRTGETSDVRAFDQYFQKKNAPTSSQVSIIPKSPRK